MSYFWRGTAEEARTAEAMLKSIRVFLRRQYTMLEYAKRVSNERMWNLSVGTEGLGLHGEENPLTQRDLKLLEEFTGIVEDILHYKPANMTPEQYIPTILRDLEIMYADAMIRSRRLEAVQAIVPGEAWKDAAPPPTDRKRMDEWAPPAVAGSGG